MTAPEPTPTAATTGLTEVLADHRWIGHGLRAVGGDCACGWRLEDGGDVLLAMAYPAHLADVTTAHLAARLSDPDVVEAAAALERAKALADEWERLDRQDMARNQYAMIATRKDFTTELRDAIEGR